MTIKKLTVAAAIAVGIATCSLNSAMAACPCNSPAPMVTGPACPIEQALPVVTGAACPVETAVPKCDKCQKPKADCGCKEKAAPKCNKCHKPKAACGCEKPAPKCDKCKKAKADCGCKEKAPCPDLSCDQPAMPTCAVCPGTGKPDSKDMKQVYAYPNAVYGTNNYVGEPASSIYTADNAILPTPMLSQNVNGATVASDGQITGAATQLPCLNEAPTRHNGIIIDRNDRQMDNASCPVDISTANSLDAIKKSFVPFEIPQGMTGAAANMNTCAFPDVPNGYWAACDIDKLAINDVVVGYPDRMFRPGRNISRAEFATILVKGMNMDNCGLDRQHIFKDVPTSNWANPLIAKAVNEDLMKGYPDGTFKPHNPVTRAEALCTIAKSIKCEIDQCKADEILSKYSDGASVPSWARIPVAKALDAGALKDMPNPNMIAPAKDASRAEVASMMQTVRVAVGLDTNPKTANEICPICPDNKQAYVENEEVIKIPTLKLSMLDQITAKSSHVGQSFRAKSMEDITINGTTFPCGSTVMGKVVEVVRPSGCNKGALKLAFTEIKNGDCKAVLPKQILTAQINKSKQVNPVARLVEAPFTWAGSIVGVTGRTVGGAIANLGNAAENVGDGVGMTLGNVFQGQFGAAGRSLGDAVVQTVKAPVDITRTALSGTMGLFQTTGDEVAYLVDPSGYKISAVNPKEHVTIAFGCSGQ